MAERQNTGLQVETFTDTGHESTAPERTRTELGGTAYSGARELFLLDEDDMDAHWQEKALCGQTDPEAFFPDKGGSTREAKKVCLNCEVRNDCLESALANDERFGVWGGMTERERRKLKKRTV